MKLLKKIIVLKIFFLFYLGCSALGNKVIINENRDQHKAVYEDRNVKVIAYMDYKILFFILDDITWSRLAITLYFNFQKAHKKRFYIIDKKYGITSVGDKLTRIRDKGSKMVVFMGATPECMKSDEDYVFSEGDETPLSKEIFRLFYPSDPVIVSIDPSWVSGSDSPIKHLEKVKKLIVKIEYFDNPNLFAKNGFKTIKELNFYASMYNYYYPPLGKDGEPNWSLLKNISDELKSQKKMFYKKSRKLFKLIKDNRKILTFEFNVNFSEKFIRNRTIDFRSKSK